MLLKCLTDELRHFMLSEIDLDITSDNLYISQRLSDRGISDYEGLLRSAVARENISWLAKELDSLGRLKATEQRVHSDGKISLAKVPSNASTMLSEGEFNRFYIRGLCVFKITRELATPLVAYRAKQVSTPRPGSEARIGLTFNADSLLADLRQNVGIETALGIPGGPNSGISICLG